jgi:two-component system, cell cycle response regulator DivK
MVAKPDTWMQDHTLALSGTREGRLGTRMSSEGLQDVASPFVLVVEDYPDAREMYSEYLRFSGFRVAEARNGEEALEKAFTLGPDVILMDLALPLMDGWEATRRLKSDPRTAQILVVALTGHALAGHQEGARRAGCDSFVTKPCLPDELVDEIRRLLAIRDAGASNGASEAAVVGTEATAVPATVPVVSHPKPVFNPS